MAPATGDVALTVASYGPAFGLNLPVISVAGLLLLASSLDESIGASRVWSRCYGSVLPTAATFGAGVAVAGEAAPATIGRFLSYLLRIFLAPKSP